MKKIAIITTHPIQYQIPLFKKLKRSKIKPIIFFASKHGLTKRNVDHEFLKKIKWDINSDILSGYKSYFPKNQNRQINDFLLTFDNLEKYLIKEKVEYTLVLGWNNIHYLKSIYLSYINKIKIILRVETNLYSTRNFFKNILKKILFRFFFKVFSHFLYIGKLNKEFYLYHKVPFKKLYPSPYFVDNDFFQLKTSKNKIKKKLKINSNKKVVLFVGKFISRKNPFEFIKLAELYRSHDDLIFLMIGSGYLEKVCNEYIKKKKLKNISLLGFINQKKIREYYRASDLLVVPSIYETWGLNINEAFASQTPVICSDVCGASADLIDEGKTGFKYKVGDLNKLYKKTNIVLYNKRIYARMIKNIKIKIKRYSIDQTLDSLKKIINEG